MKHVAPVLVVAATVLALNFIAQDVPKPLAPTRYQQATMDLKIAHPALYVSEGEKFQSGVPITVSINDNEDATLRLVYNEDKVVISENDDHNLPNLHFKSKDNDNGFSLYRVTELGPGATCDGCWRIMTHTSTGGLRDEALKESEIQAKIDAL